MSNNNLSNPEKPEAKGSNPTQESEAGFRGQPNPNAGAPPANNTLTSLYVGDLDASATEAMLFELFNMIGPVSSIRVCRDAVTRKSLGYAYVNYMKPEDAADAIEKLNYTLIKEKPIRIMSSQRDPASRKSGAGNVFIKNLHADIDHKALHDTFSTFGNVLSCKVAMENGVSKGYGFIQYEKSEDAENAIKSVNGMLLNDQAVYVAHHLGKKERVSKAEEIKSKFTNIFTKNLDPSVTTEDLETLFKTYGKITSANVSVDEEGKSKCFGFVNFEDHDSAQKAVDELNEKEFKGTKIYVGRAQKKSEREDELKKQFEQLKLEKINKSADANLYVKNIDEAEIDTNDKLKAQFEGFGEITSCRLMMDEKNVSKGFGFVCFENVDAANKAVSEMNGKMIGSKPIYVAVAQRKEDRRSQLEAQLSQRMPPRGYPMPGMPFPPGANPMMFQNPFMGRNMPLMNPYGQAPMNPRGNYNMMSRPNVPQMGRAPFGMPMMRPGMQMHPGQPMHPGQMQPGQQMPPGQMQHGQQMPPGQPMPPSISDIYKHTPDEQKKQFLGESLYYLINRKDPHHAAKITGMLLELKPEELFKFFDNHELLDQKIAEAKKILTESGRNVSNPSA